MVRQLASLLLLAFVLLSLSMMSGLPAHAADLGQGARIFKANCISCHRSGRNIVTPQKTLAKADLEAYGMYSSEAIIHQITYGKEAMPAFDRLSEEDIENVAAYVLAQADAGWPQLRRAKKKHCRQGTCHEQKGHFSEGVLENSEP